MQETRVIKTLTCKIIQANVNHSGRTQDLAQEGCGLGILSEPYNVREGLRWMVSLEGGAAIYWRDALNSPPREPHIRERGFVAAFRGPIVVIFIYLPPSLMPDNYARWL